MADDSVELFQNWDGKRMPFPALVSEKLDGVPVRIRRVGSHILGWTRQNEPVKSIPHILELVGPLLADGGSVVGECYIEGMPFKQIGGYVRRVVADQHTKQLTFNVWDADLLDTPEMAYEARMAMFDAAWAKLLEIEGRSPTDLPVRRIPGVTVYSEADALKAFELVMTAKPTAEGVCVHSLAKGFVPGKRGWGSQRIKPVPTIDLLITGFEEAVSKKTGIGHGRVGRIIAEFNYTKGGKMFTKQIGVGPGALTHKQAEALWRVFKNGEWTPTVAEIKYMRDDTYEALRQPTFMRFRPEKKEGELSAR